MMDSRYLEVRVEEIPQVSVLDGISITIICGRINDISGPVHDLVADPEFFDVSLKPGAHFTHPVKAGYMAAVFVFDGTGTFDQQQNEELLNRIIALYGDEEDSADIYPGRNRVRFMFFSGKTLCEPIT